MNEEWLDKLRTLLNTAGFTNVDAFLGCADTSAYEDLGHSIKLELEDLSKIREIIKR